MRQLKITNSITNREAQSLEKYLQEISKLDMISPDEEVRLAGLIKKGDKGALDKLTKANLRFVVSVAKQYGLMKAARKFDDSRGFKFISFAVWWIRQNILHALAEHARMIRLPLNKVALNNRIQKAHSMLEQQLERSPSADELAEILDIDLDEVTESLGRKERHVSLDMPFSEDEEGTLIDTLENHNAEKTDNELYHAESLKLELSRSLKILSDRQKETLFYFFGIGMDHPLSLDDIAQKLEVTPERVRQIKDKAISRLRASRNFNLLRGFLNA